MAADCPRAGKIGASGTLLGKGWRMNVGLIFGGRSVEHQVSITSARTVKRGLEEAGHRVIPLGIAQDGCWIPTAAAAAVLAGGAKAIEAVGTPVAPTLVHLTGSGAEALFPI